MQRIAHTLTMNSERLQTANFASGPKRAWAYSIIMALFACLILTPTTTRAQGSIFGSVKNADLSAPEAGDLRFFGFVNGSDYELHTDFIVGAGYDNGNWYDDFQNYLNNSAGSNYRYYFWNPSTNEGFALLGQIPNNSFEQEDIQLVTVTWPQPPTNVAASRLNDTAVDLTWEAQAGNTYHVYRRISGVNGSFYRIDNELGELSDPGVTVSSYHDGDAGGEAEFEYIILAENTGGQYSQPSAVVVPTLSSQCCTLPGDVDSNGKVNIGDVTFLLSRIFANGAAPGCMQQADVDQNNRLNIGDVTFLLSRIFANGPAPTCPNI